jgi:ligand-binding sensor domain-containing protein
MNVLQVSYKVSFVICFSLISAFVWSQNSQIGLPITVNYSPKDYHAHPNNFAVIQGKNGVMYFGNNEGILEFDGEAWRKIKLPNAGACTSLAIDDKGVIYAGGQGQIGLLKPDSLGALQYHSILELLTAECRNFQEVWKIFNTNEGVVYASYEAVFILKDGKIKILKPQTRFGNAFLVNDKVYFTDLQGMMLITDGKLEHMKGFKVVAEQFVSSMLSCRETLLVASHAAGIFEYAGDTISLWNTPVNNMFASSKIDKAMVLKDSTIIFSTNTNGIVVTNRQGEVLLHLNKNRGLVDNTITNLYIDDNQNLWLTTLNGISFVQLLKPCTTLSSTSGITGIAYSSVVDKGKLYLGTSDGLFIKDISEKQQHLEPFKKVNDISGLVWNVSAFENVIFCGHISSSFVIKAGKINKITNRGTWIFLPLSQTNYMLVGTYAGLEIWENNKGNWQFRNQVKGFKESSRFVIEDDLGDIWISHGNKGVYQLRLNKSLDSVSYSRFYDAKNGLPGDFGNTIFKIGHDVVVTTESGILKFDRLHNEFIPWDPVANLFTAKDKIERLVQRDNCMWVVYDQGIVAKLRMNNKAKYEVLWQTEKFKNQFVGAFEHLNPITENDLLVATQDGFLLFTDTQLTNQYKFTTHIAKAVLTTNPYTVLWAGYEQNKKNIVDLPFDQNAIRFTFSSNNYEDFELHRYQFYLEGLGRKEGWLPWTNENIKDYTNLPHGGYVFHVRARNSLGKISEEDVIHFTISPPWYKSITAYGLYVIAIVFLLLLSVRLVRKRFAQQRKRLELNKQHDLWLKQKEWDEATLKIEKQILSLQQQKLISEADALKEKEILLEKEKQLKEEQTQNERRIRELEKEKYETTLLNKNSELNSLALHITQKNEILTSIRSQLAKPIKDSSDDDTKLTLKQIDQMIQKGMYSADDWQKFQETFNIVHDDVLKRIKEKYPELKPSALKLCAYLRMGLSTKQIASLLNTSPLSVAKARYRLKERLNLEKGIRLRDFLNSF